MSINPQDPVLAWRRVANAVHSFRPSIQLQMKALKTWLAQQGGNPDLEFVPFASLSDSETVIANAACKLFAAVFKKALTATATFSKLTDSATTSSDAASEFRMWQSGSGNEGAIITPHGQSFANGITMQGNTTANGGTTSGADAASGFILLGRP